MKYHFDTGIGVVIAHATVVGPNMRLIAHLAVDTGASRTCLSAALLERLGYDLTQYEATRRVMTASGMTTLARIEVARLSALGQDRLRMPVLSLTLPQDIGVDGVLGLDFFHDTILRINFRAGEIEVTQ